MTGKMLKKRRNPQVVDNWLDSLELYRKSVAHDETCLFRAVSEQLFDCQVFHERVRKECIDYGKTHHSEFSNFIPDKSEWEEHLNLLEKHMTICGDIEINLISRNYERDVIVACANQQTVNNVTKRYHINDPLMLCLLDVDHYDAVYRKGHIDNAGFCQATVYKVLYEGVFQITNVDNIVKSMLYEKIPILRETDATEETNKPDANSSDGTNNSMVAPFPFKVAKALDPSIYRNIEYDSWNDVRKELKLNEWYKGDDNLKLGTKCVLRDPIDNVTLECYIQQFHEDKDKCIVYITKYAEKRLVKYMDLSPEDNAKPWPLPYRFSRNLVLNTPTLAPMDKVKSTRKKNKESKQQSKSTNDLSEIGKSDNVCGYVGAPLQMQERNTAENKPDAASDKSSNNMPPLAGLGSVVQDDNNNQQERFSWDHVSWSEPLHYTQPESNFYPTTPEPYVCNPASAAPFIEIKPMIASAPVTPSVVSYHDNSFPYYFNYHVQYPMTPSTPIPIVPVSQSSQDTNTLTSIRPNSVETAQYIPQSTLQPLDVYSPPVLPPVIYTTVPAHNVAVMVPPSPTAAYPAPCCVYSNGGEMTMASGYETGQWLTPNGISHNAQGFFFPPVNPQNDQ
ncbi:hypothetical protein ABEB36_012279 [Hypothenemus hampei]|uniref:OTU domain-containing protein n=1 Tax=Hypothenemus hampei TaxID=57062 RepID=A0ABD1EAM8_HYPHA